VCPTRDKKLAFICEKELLEADAVEDTDGEVMQPYYSIVSSTFN